MKHFVSYVLLCAWPVWGACHRIGITTHHYCPSSGDPVADGADLRDYLRIPVMYDCGDRLILDSGASYNSKQNGIITYPFVLGSQTGCVDGHPTIIGSTRADEFPDGYRPLVSDIPRMAKLVASRGFASTACGLVMCLYNDIDNPYKALRNGHYRFEGIAFSTDANISGLDYLSMGEPLVSVSNVQSDTKLIDQPIEMEFIHNLLTNGETELYGPLANCTGIPCAYRSSQSGFAVGGEKILIKDSSVYGLGGFDPSFGNVISAVVGAAGGGTSYTVGDTFTINGGLPAYPNTAAGTVTAVTAGVVTAVTITNGGQGYLSGGGDGYGVTATSGSGHGLALSIKAGPVTHTSITEVSNASPAIIHKIGIAATLGLTAPTGTECNNPTDGKPSCMLNCLGSGHCTFTLGQNAPAGWELWNGAKAATYVDADHVALDYAHSLTEWEPTHLDATGFPAWSGTAQFRRGGATVTPVYNLIAASFVGLQAVNNYFENGDMTFFVAGGSYATATGVVQAGSTSSSIVVANAGPAKIGDLITVAAPGISVYCAPTGDPGTNACRGGGVRVGRITVIAGAPPNMTFSVVPVGPDGIDVAPTVGKICAWQGIVPGHLRFDRNKIFRDYNAFPVGKGAFEMKACDTCLITGNLSYGTPNATDFFLEVKNQGTGSLTDGTNVPWSTARNLSFRYNLHGSSLGGGVRYALNCGDFEHTNTPCDNVWMEDNVMPQARTQSTGNNFLESGTAENSGYRHNTVTASLTSPNTWNVYPNSMTCTNSGAPFLDDYIKHKERVYDNIVSYGESFVGNVPCWPGYTATVHHNVFIADGSVNTSTILSDHPDSNFATAALAGVGMAGSCTFDTWQNCGLSLASTYKGAASDGRDPGADILKVNDYQNGWSEAAGFVEYSALTATYNTKAWAINPGTTTATLRFHRFSPLANCSVKIYTDPSRQTLHADTASGGNQACSRSGATDDGDVVTFNAGAVSALTSVTPYYVVVQDGGREMVISFRTK